MPLYHKDVYMPADLRLPRGTMLLEYGGHARQEAFEDRYGKIKLPKVINFSEYEVIEVETQGNKVKKVLYRGSLDSRRDICIVLVPHRGFVKTVWVNLKSDKHRTLDTTKYDKE